MRRVRVAGTGRGIAIYADQMIRADMLSRLELRQESDDLLRIGIGIDCPRSRIASPDRGGMSSSTLLAKAERNSATSRQSIPIEKAITSLRMSFSSQSCRSAGAIGIQTLHRACLPQT
jgi:hypothetical protein